MFFDLNTDYILADSNNFKYVDSLKVYLSKNKTLIQVWTQNVINLNRTKEDNFWGLGDLLRGTIKMYQISKKYNYDFDICINKHPISKHLVYESKYDNILLNIDIMFIKPYEVESYIESQTDNLIYLLTNDFCDENQIDDFIINKIKNIFRPNYNIQTDVDKYIKQYNPKRIIHMRIGDNFIKNENNIDLTTYINYLKRNKFDLLMTDSNILKQEAKKYDLPVIDFEVGHIGYNNDELMVKNTLIEFLILTKAEEIYTYSNYHWISGFVYWASKIYNIKLTKIKDLK